MNVPEPIFSAAAAAPDGALAPFQGIRFRPDLPGGLAAALGPPADLDSSAEAHAFVRERAHSAVRLEIEDDVEPLRFDHARQLLRRWLDDDILTRDDRPAYYVYTQAFGDYGVTRTRRGVFGLVPLAAPHVCVLPHEETWEDNRQRRLQLLRDLDAAISPVFLVYDGADQRPDALLDAVTARPPDAEAGDDFANTHRLWVVDDPAEVEQLRAALDHRHFIIADGHHRFAAAQLYHQERPALETGVVLALCVEAHDPGIVIRPIHRAITGRDALDLLGAAGELAQWFELETQPVGDLSGHDLLARLPDDDVPTAAVITNGGASVVTLRLRDWHGVEPLLPDVVDAARRLDVTVFTELLLRRALQLDPELETALAYTSDASAVLAAVQRGHAGLGLLLRPVRLEQVLAVARAHGTVPQKSTAFTPKVPLGLVMHVFGGA